MNISPARILTQSINALNFEDGVKNFILKIDFHLTVKI